MMQWPFSKLFDTGHGSISLLAVLSRLIWLCVLPLLLLALFLAVTHVRTLQVERTQEAANYLHNAKVALDRTLGWRIGGLQILATSPLADAPARMGDFYQEALRFRSQLGGHIILADPQMQMLFNTRVDFGTALPKLPKPKGHAAAPAALATGRPAVGDQFFGPIAKEPLVAIAVPVLRDGTPRALLLSTVEAVQFQERLDVLSLPADWILTLVDGNNAAIARRGPAESKTSYPLPGSLQVAKLDNAPWSLRLAIPADVYWQPLLLATLALGMAVLAGTLLSIWGGRVASHVLAKSVQSLISTPSAQKPLPRITEVENVRGLMAEATTARETAEQAQRTTDKELQVKQSLLNAIAEGTTDAVYVKDLDGRYLMFNRAATQIIAKSAEEVLGHDDTAIFPEAEARMIMAGDRGVLAKGGPMTYEEVVSDGEGKTRVFLSTKGPLRDAQGNVTGLFGIARDITEIKQNLDQLRQERDFSEAVLDSLPGVFYLYDENLKFIRWNKAFSKVLGYSPEEIAALSPLDFFAGDDKQMLTERIQRVFDQGFGEVEADFVAKDGSRTPYFFTGVKIDLAGKTCLLGVGIDIAARKQAEQELRQHKEHLEELVAERTARLEALNHELEAFSYSVSHDLRAPLRAIGGFTHILAKRYRQLLDEQGQHYFDNILQASDRMSQLIDELLNYSRLGRRGVQLRPVALGKILATLREERAQRLEETGAVLSVASDLPLVLGDPTLLVQAFGNLLDNALIYRRQEVEPRISVEWERVEEEIQVSVRDNGIGIAPEYQQKIFEVFQRLHSDDELPGTGIGLSIVKKVADLLGGRVWVESCKGEGSVFKLRLQPAPSSQP